MKRIFDIFISLIAIFVFAIPVLLIAIIIYCQDRQSVLFFQERLGKNKIPFFIIKFRTMLDGEVTPIGFILRRTGLDEIPQFVNVLKGDMCVVGPRALTNEDVVRLKWDGEHYRTRWIVKPGITGYAQIYGGQHKKTSWFWDRKYISRPMFHVDICIIFVSFLMNILGKTRVRQWLFCDQGLD